MLVLVPVVAGVIFGTQRVSSDHPLVYFTLIDVPIGHPPSLDVLEEERAVI